MKNPYKNFLFPVKVSDLSQTPPPYGMRIYLRVAYGWCNEKMIKKLQNPMCKTYTESFDGEKDKSHNIKKTDSGYYISAEKNNILEISDIPLEFKIEKTQFNQNDLKLNNLVNMSVDDLHSTNSIIKNKEE